MFRPYSTITVPGKPLMERVFMKGPILPGLDTVCKAPALLLAHPHQNYLLLLFSPGALSAAQHLFLFLCIKVSTCNKQRRNL